MKDFLIQKAYADTGLANPGGGGGNSTVDTLLRNINNQIVTPLIYLMAALAVLYFLLGVFKFIQNADSPEERETGFKHMIWGVVGIFIMVSAKAIIYVILASLGLN